MAGLYKRGEDHGRPREATEASSRAQIWAWTHKLKSLPPPPGPKATLVSAFEAEQLRRGEEKKGKGLG